MGIVPRAPQCTGGICTKRARCDKKLTKSAQNRIFRDNSGLYLPFCSFLSFLEDFIMSDSQTPALDASLSWRTLPADPAQAETAEEMALVQEMMSLIQESQQVVNSFPEEEGSQSDPLLAMMQMFQATQQIADQEDAAPPAVQVPPSPSPAAHSAEEMELMDEMMALIQESQQVFNTLDNLMPESPAVPNAQEMAAAMNLVQAAADTDVPQLRAALSGDELLQLFKRGGEVGIALTQYCVRSVNLSPLFVHLVSEYRLRPNLKTALALYDCFCAPQAAARLPVCAGLHSELAALQQSVHKMRNTLAAIRDQELQPPAPTDEQEARPRVLNYVPEFGLFDALVKAVRNSVEFDKACRQYDPARAVWQNLEPEGMTQAARVFVARIWQPQIRPQLVAAGFWRLQTIE